MTEHPDITLTERLRVYALTCETVTIERDAVLHLCNLADYAVEHWQASEKLHDQVMILAQKAKSQEAWHQKCRRQAKIMWFLVIASCAFNIIAGFIR